MRPLVLTPKLKRAFRKFVNGNPDLQQRIEDTLREMEADVFAPAEGFYYGKQLSGRKFCHV